MKILITVASGSVGSGATEALSADHELRLSDLARVDAKFLLYEADVREPGALDEASQGVDIIIHTPAYHDIHSGKRSEQKFYDLNVTGTFQMFQSAVRNRVRRIVWLSSLSFYGSSFYSYKKKLANSYASFP